MSKREYVVAFVGYIPQPPSPSFVFARTQLRIMVRIRLKIYMVRDLKKREPASYPIESIFFFTLQTGFLSNTETGRTALLQRLSLQSFSTKANFLTPTRRKTPINFSSYLAIPKICSNKLLLCNRRDVSLLY